MVRVSEWALWLKALHIVAFAAWMAALWYLPRLLVYHRDAAVGGELSETLKVMERRLLRAIAGPAMGAALLLGAALASAQHQWGDRWLHLKLVLVAGLAGCHALLAHDVRRFADDRRPRTARWYRVLNEVPTLLLVGIALLAVLQPL